MKCFNVLDLHYIFYFHFRHPKCYLCLMLTLIFLHVLVLVASPPPQVLSHEDLGKFLRLNQFSLLGSQPISEIRNRSSVAQCVATPTTAKRFKPTALLRILSRNPASSILTGGIKLQSLSGPYVEYSMARVR